MEKTAKREITLKSGIEMIIESRRSITSIEGDAWEGRPDETLYIENVRISFFNPQTQKNEIGSGLRILNSGNKFDAEYIKKGAYARVESAQMFASKESYDAIKSAIDAVEAETMMPEWEEHFSAIAKKETEKKIALAKRIIENGDKEIANTGMLLTSSQVRAWQKNYNDIHNEGGDGFIPSRISKEEYDEAVSFIANITK
jgi:hypothetical protein